MNTFRKYYLNMCSEYKSSEVFKYILGILQLGSICDMFVMIY